MWELILQVLEKGGPWGVSLLAIGAVFTLWSKNQSLYRQFLKSIDDLHDKRVNEAKECMEVILSSIRERDKLLEHLSGAMDTLIELHRGRK
jgi:hypothetical protein